MALQYRHLPNANPNLACLLISFSHGGRLSDQEIQPMHVTSMAFLEKAGQAPKALQPKSALESEETLIDQRRWPIYAAMTATQT
jgi:hypothetical protein